MQFQDAWEWILTSRKHTSFRTIAVVVTIQVAVEVYNKTTNNDQAVFVQTLIGREEDATLFLPAISIRQRAKITKAG